MNITRKLSYFQFAIGLLLSPMGNASPIGFLDLGRTTLDTQSGLEWLDVTETVNRPYHDVLAATLSPSDPLGAEGWRYATRLEFEQLISNFLGISYRGGTVALSVSDDVRDFIQLFGDTWQIWCSHMLCSVDGIIGNTDGRLGDISPDRGLGEPELYQGIVTNPAPVPANPAGIVEDGVYRLASTQSWGVGSWLVRGTSNVPEPPTIALSLLSLLLVPLVRRHHAPNASLQGSAPQAERP